LKYILAIDSGATKSEVLLYPVIDGSAAKTKARLYKYPFINLNLLGMDESVKRLKKITANMTKLAGKGSIIAIAAGISGARYEKDRKKIASALRKTTGLKNITILPDTEIALAAAFEPRERNCGILIAGTGSILYYRDSSGDIRRIGGWGRHIGDEGSGHWIAREALYHVTKHYDGRINAPKLARVIEKEFGIHSGNIIKHVYHNGFEISKLTKHVFRCAASGDKASREIIRSAAENLLTHFIPLNKKPYTIAMTGSLLTEEKLLTAEMKKAAKKLYPNITLVKPEFSPVWGAVKIALQNVK
jgi:N-acetylglucosamine kinase